MVDKNVRFERLANVLWFLQKCFILSFSDAPQNMYLNGWLPRHEQ